MAKRTSRGRSSEQVAGWLLSVVINSHLVQKPATAAAKLPVVPYGVTRPTAEHGAKRTADKAGGCSGAEDLSELIQDTVYSASAAQQCAFHTSRN